MRLPDGLETITLLLQLVVPLALIARVGLRRHRGGMDLALDAVLAIIYTVAIAVTGLWLGLPRYLILAYLGLLVPATCLGARAVGREAPAGSRVYRFGLLLRGGATVFLLAVMGLAVAGRRPPDEPAVRLTSPLRSGTYLVAAGGNSTLINPHLKTLTGDRYRRHRGQSHGVDLVRVGRWGSRRSVPFPPDPTGYAIFGEPVHAPCPGRVVAAVDGYPDHHSRGSAPPALEGNHVILQCGSAWVVLAHLEQGSVGVRKGDVVETGQPLGRVGNSGRSDEPHLHLHVQTAGEEGMPFGGLPLRITVDGRYLVRNDRVHERSSPGNRGHTQS